jgi:hypothetical protein
LNAEDAVTEKVVEKVAALGGVRNAVLNASGLLENGGVGAWEQVRKVGRGCSCVLEWARSLKI